MESPETFAGANVEAADIAFIVLITLRRRAFLERRADDDDVSRDDRRALEADFSRDEVGKNRLIDVGLEVDGAVRAEATESTVARLCVERDQPIARRDVENPFFAPVGPIRQTAAGERPWRGGAALAFILAMHPALRARHGVERDDSAAGSARGVQRPADHQRRALELELGARTERVGLETPRNLERAEVAGR